MRSRTLSLAFGIAAVLLIGSMAQATTTTFGRGQAGDYAPDKFDAVSMSFLTNGNAIDAAGDPASTEGGTYQDSGEIHLMGIEGLFSLIPPTSGADTIEIISAGIELMTDYGVGGGETLSCYRVQTDWLVGTAGTNAYNVHSDASDVSGGAEWQSNVNGTIGVPYAPDGWSWGTNDYTTTHGVSVPFVQGWGESHYLDITDMLQDAYDTNENFGWAFMSTDSTPGEIRWISPNTGGSKTGKEPIVTIEYQYTPAVAQYYLDVINGSGTGSYEVGEIAGILADAPVTAGQGFDQWTGDVAAVDDVSDPDTFIIMPAVDITVTATYADLYTLTVESGTGGGDYVAGAIVPIDATIPPDYAFVQWVGDVTGVADVNAASTTITTPAVDSTVTATFVLVASDLTVVNGSGSGAYTWNAAVPITAAAPPTGDVFYKWIGDTEAIADIYDSPGTVNMPDYDLTVTATYITPGAYSLTIESGSGDGMYDEGEVVNIIAEPVMTGKAFYRWHGDYANIDDRYITNTIITMPAGDVSITAGFTDLFPYSVSYKQNGTNPSHTVVTFDDVQILFSASGNATDIGDGTYITLTMSDEDTSGSVLLVGLADLFDRLPVTDANSGRDMFIHAATLTFTAGNPVDNVTVACDRVVTNWLLGTPGTNQSNVHSDASDAAGLIEWASNPNGIIGGSYSPDGWSWGASDSSIAERSTVEWNGDWGAENAFDVTDALRASYAAGINGGFVIRVIAAGGEGGVLARIRCSEQDFGPTLDITYGYSEPTPLYVLTVISGSGSGEKQALLPAPIVADAAATGLEFNLWIGDTDGIADETAASTTIALPYATATITALYKTAGMPTDYWPVFNEFCKEFFGAEKEPLTYDHAGTTLEFMSLSDSEWVYESETSATIAFETNLPASTYIEYGETASYGSTANIETDRYYYLHMAHLTGLTADTTYHYRFVAEDERGNVIVSGDKTFDTVVLGSVTRIPGQHITAAQYNISTSGYYLLEGDVIADNTGFFVSASGVTIDLGGYTLTYNNVRDDPEPDAAQMLYDSAMGVKAYWNLTGIKVVNGRIVQGSGANGTASNGTGYNPIRLSEQGACEIAGLSIEWAGSQITGITASGGLNVHHNILLDRGWQVPNRHSGCDAIDGANTAHHNLVKRFRHRGIMGGSDGSYYNNELYGDTFASNAFAIDFYGQTNSVASNNRIFGGGYNLVGLGATSESANIEFNDNFLHMQAIKPYDASSNRGLEWNPVSSQWEQEYGEKSATHFVRVIWGADNIQFNDNMMIAYAREGGDCRGIWAQTDPLEGNRQTNVAFRNNTVKFIFEDDWGDEGSAVLMTGKDDNTDEMLFEDNLLISNACMVRFASDYGGSPDMTTWRRNTFVRDLTAWDRFDYAMIRIGYGGSYASRYHYFYDSTFEDCSYDEVWHDGTGDNWFVVGWTLTVETEADANVVITDALAIEVFNGTADANGICVVELDQYQEHPLGNTNYTDHEVTVTTTGGTYVETVTVDATKTVQIPSAPAPVYWDGDLNTDEIVNITDLNMVLIDWSKSGGFSDARSDANGDGTVDIVDLNTVLIDWGKTGFQP